MNYINNVFRLSRELNKKYRLGNLDDEVGEELNRLSEQYGSVIDTNNTNKTKEDSSVVDPVIGNTSGSDAATPKEEQAKEKGKGKGKAPAPAPKPDTVVSTAKGQKTPAVQPKLTGPKALINKGIGGFLKVRSAVRGVLRDYAQTRMNTFLHMGGGFSPAMREKVMSHSQKASEAFIQKAFSSGKGIKLSKIPSFVNLIDTLHAKRITGSGRQRILDKMLQYHISGELESYINKGLSKDIAKYKTKEYKAKGSASPQQTVNTTAKGKVVKGPSITTTTS